MSKEWYNLRGEGYSILQREDTLKEIVRLLGPEGLPEEEKLVLEVARMIKIGILQQSAYDKIDTYCVPAKQLKLLKIIVEFGKEANKALKEGDSLPDITKMPIITRLLKAKFEIPNDQLEKFDELANDMIIQFKQLTGKQEVEH